MAFATLKQNHWPLIRIGRTIINILIVLILSPLSHFDKMLCGCEYISKTAALCQVVQGL